MCQQTNDALNKSDPTYAAGILCGVFRKHFGVIISNDDMKRFVLDRWPTLSTYSHVIHDNAEFIRAGWKEVEQKPVEVAYKP